MRGTLCIAILSTLVVAGCGQAGGASDHAMPPEVVTLYDAAALDGMMEIELNRDGTFVEMEADIPVADLPANLLEAANEQLPGGEVTGAEIEFVRTDGGWTKSFEVKKEIDGLEYELVLDEGGNVLEKEMEIAREDAPAEVLAAAEAAIAGGTFQSVERIDVGEETVYHVKLTKGGASFKVVLEPDGAVVRKVREQKAEIEIPLAD